MDKNYMWECINCKKLYERGKLKGEIDYKNNYVSVKCLICNNQMHNKLISDIITYYDNEEELKDIDKEAKCVLCNRYFQRKANEDKDTKSLCKFAYYIPKRAFSKEEDDFVVDVDYWCNECMYANNDSDFYKD